MHTVKICCTALAVMGVLAGQTLRAGDTKEQADLREMLRKSLNQSPAAPASQPEGSQYAPVPPAAPIKTVEPKALEEKPAAEPAAAETPAPEPKSAKSKKASKPVMAPNAVSAAPPAESAAPVFAPVPPAASAEAEGTASDPELRYLLREVAVEPAAQPTATVAPTAVEAPAPAVAPEPAEAPAVVAEPVPAPAPAPAPEPVVTKAPAPVIQSPSTTVSASKENQLAALLKLYMADAITPDEYHHKRAAILAEP